MGGILLGVVGPDVGLEMVLVMIGGSGAGVRCAVPVFEVGVSSGGAVIAGDEFEFVEDGGYSGTTGKDGIDVVAKLFWALAPLGIDALLGLFGEFGLVWLRVTRTEEWRVSWPVVRGLCCNGGRVSSSNDDVRGDRP